MKRVAFVFSTVPHGSASGREGLDALLATSALTEDLGVFFIGDGVFQILQGQQPDAVLAREAQNRLFAERRLLCVVVTDKDIHRFPRAAFLAVASGVLLRLTRESSITNTCIIPRFTIG